MKLVLGLVAMALAALLVLQWLEWPPRMDELTAGTGAGETPSPEASSPVTPGDLLAPPVEREDYAHVVERPLFMPTRRPPEEEPEEPEPPPEQTPAVELDKFDLNAILITPAESIAWVRSPSTPTPQRLRPGDELEGWTVKAIKEGQIEVERQGETDTLILRDYDNHPPPVARAPSRPRPPRAEARSQTPLSRTATPQPRPEAAGSDPNPASKTATPQRSAGFGPPRSNARAP